MPSMRRRASETCTSRPKRTSGTRRGDLAPLLIEAKAHRGRKERVEEDEWSLVRRRRPDSTAASRNCQQRESCHSSARLLRMPSSLRSCPQDAAESHPPRSASSQHVRGSCGLLEMERRTLPKRVVAYSWHHMPAVRPCHKARTSQGFLPNKGESTRGTRGLVSDALWPWR